MKQKYFPNLYKLPNSFAQIGKHNSEWNIWLSSAPLRRRLCILMLKIRSTRGQYFDCLLTSKLIQRGNTDTLHLFCWLHLFRFSSFGFCLHFEYVDIKIPFAVYFSRTMRAINQQISESMCSVVQILHTHKQTARKNNLIT